MLKDNLIEVLIITALISISIGCFLFNVSIGFMSIGLGAGLIAYLFYMKEGK